MADSLGLIRWKCYRNTFPSMWQMPKLRPITMLLLHKRYLPYPDMMEKAICKIIIGVWCLPGQRIYPSVAGYLRYYLKLNIDATAHSALGDVLVLEGLFQRIYAKFKGQAIDPVADMINISSSPVLVPRMPFGKHKGLKMAEVPEDYLQWLAGTDLDKDLAYTVRHYLGGPIQDMEYDAGI